MDRYHLIIDGKKLETSGYADVTNPANGEIVGRMPLATVADLDLAVSSAAKAFPLWAAKSSSERAAACAAIASKIEAHADELAKRLTQEQGKPLGGLGSRFEIGGAQAWTNYTGSLDLPVETLQDGPEGRVELHRKPIGVVGSITPWNWPVMIACWHIIPAIRVGNTVVIKPSPYTPLSTIRLVELINVVLPPGVVNVVTGSDDIGAHISSHPGIAKVTFTGSTNTGRKIMASAANTALRPDRPPREILGAADEAGARRSMSLSATCVARIVRRFEAMPTSAAISWRCDPPRFRQMIRHRRGGRGSDNAKVY